MSKWCRGEVLHTKTFIISLQPVAAVSIMHKRGGSWYSVEEGESQFL